MKIKKIYRKSIVRKLLAGLLFCQLIGAGAVLAVPGSMNFQGALTNADGSRLSDGSYDISFSLYTVASGGTAVWTETHSGIAVQHGVFSVELGSITALDGTDFNGDTYLGISVGTGSEMTPRQQLLTVAYALKAGDAETLEGNTTANLDARYINEGQANAVTSAMIQDSAITAADLAAGSVGASEIATSGVASAEVVDNSLTAADLAADSVGASEISAGAVGSSEVLDNSLTAADLAVDSVGASEIAKGAVRSIEVLDNSLTAVDLAAGSVGASEISTGAVGSSEVLDNSLTAADLAVNSVGSSEITSGAVGTDEINWSLNHTDSDANGGILSLTNSSDATFGNYPMGIYGAASGSPTSNPVIGVFGGAPGLSGASVALFPNTKIGVGGASDTGYGVAGVSTSGYGVYGRSSSSHAGYFTTEYSYGRGVYGVATNTGAYLNYGGYFSAAGAIGRGVYGYASGSGGYGVYGYSVNGDGIYGQSAASDEHSGSFYTSTGSGLAGAALYARTYNTTGNGIALWAHNDSLSSTDAAVVISNDGTGALLKAFGGNGGEDEFQVANDGSLFIDDPSISDPALWFDAGRALLTLGSGSATEIGDDGDLWVTDSAGINTIELNGQGGEIRLYDNAGNLGILLDPTATYAADFYGNVRVRDNAGEIVMELGAGLDYAEGFNVSNEERILSGSVLIIDPDNPGQLKLSESAYDSKVAGIVAGANGIGSGVRLGAGQFDNDIALAGRVYCNVDASQSAIKTGDLLTTSSIPGYAMKADDYDMARGAILGKAMESLDKGKTGQILVLVTLQ